MENNLSTRIGELNSLRVSAYMDIEKTTKNLNKILAYKKEASIQMLQCSDEEKMKNIAMVIKYADDIIMNILGLYK